MRQNLATDERLDTTVFQKRHLFGVLSSVSGSNSTIAGLPPTVR